MKTRIILYGKLEKKFKKEFNFYNINKPIDSIKAINTIYPEFKSEIQNDAFNGINYQMVVNDEEIKSWKDFSNKKEIRTIEIVPSIVGAEFFSLAAAIKYFLIAVAVAGITYLLTPIPEIDPQSMEQEVSPTSQSYIFGSNSNLAAQGQAVPVRYGLLRIGSSIVSSRITNEDLYEQSYKNTAVYDPGYLWLTSSVYRELNNRAIP